MRALLTPPNLLTLARMALTPLIARSILARDCPRALLLLALAAATDAIDGFLARRYNWSTRVGSYLDPIADKLLLTSAYVCLGFAGLAPAWLVWLIAGRDLAILSMAVIAVLVTSYRDFPPTRLGKLSTVVQVFSGTAILMQCAFPGLPPMTTPLVWITAAITAVSGVHYVILALHRFLHRPRIN
ncbi:MAG TPA: CDP-alcohol phosphatidyltransferase family protein [Bryobacteraceae bacterium]|nr:CDP-alcohol phosphatidyltransferase family protein [Bryobacteraceae bacterium]